MNRLEKLFARLYPASWRNRYEEEFDALLGDVNPDWRTSFDILKGALTMQLRTGSLGKIVAFVGTTGLAGLLIGLAVSTGMQKQYESESLLRIAFDQPLSAEALTIYMNQAAQLALSRPALVAIIYRYKLYPAKQAKMPLEDILTEMKNNIVVRPAGVIDRSTAQKVNTFRIEFRYQDPVIAQQVAGDLVSRFMGVAVEDVIRDPKTITLALLDGPNLPQVPVSPVFVPITLVGLGGGLILGVSIALLRRSPKPA